MSEKKQKYILTRNVLPMKAGETVELTDKQAASALYATRIRKRDSEMVNQVADADKLIAEAQAEAQAEAEKLIADAQAEAEKLIADAQAEAERIISEAEATAEELVKAAVESKPAKK